MCIDFADLNKACLKDSYHFPNIDYLVDEALRYELLSFVDAYLGYNQIQMHPWDEEKMTFVIEITNYYCFGQFARLNVEAYVDNMSFNLKLNLEECLLVFKHASGSYPSIQKIKINLYK
ncbi:hypothetical protein CR513_44974, partial [Mucuna pruriens]